MVRVVEPVRRGARLATILLAVGVASLPARLARPERAADRWTSPLQLASALITTLPSRLTPPAVPPTWQLVSMVADDIDADGDLDVVANDGSLDLVVWINDGTGRLSRQSDRKANPVLPLVAGDGIGEPPAQSQAIAHDASSALIAVAATGSGPITTSRSRRAGAHHAGLPLLLSSRSPRGPPSGAAAL